jgi:hypothetical protein
MKKTTKVTLLSILVFPGVGHLVLKKYAIALGFIASFAYLLLGFIGDIIDKSQQVIDSIVRGETPLEINAISEALAEQGVLASQQQSFAGYLLLLIWILAAFDAYRMAKKINTDFSE